MSKGSGVMINAHCANAWATLNKLPIQNPTLGCHVFNSKLKDHPKEWIHQSGWSHAAIPYRDSNPYPHPNSALPKATLSPFLFLAPLTEHHTLLQEFLCNPDLPPSNIHIPVFSSHLFSTLSMHITTETTSSLPCPYHPPFLSSILPDNIIQSLLLFLPLTALNTTTDLSNQ